MLQRAAGLLVERWKKIEGYVRRLVIGNRRARDVVAEGAKSRFARHGNRRFSQACRGRVSSREQPGRDRLYVTLNARDLSGEEYVRHCSQAKSWTQQRRSVDV